MRDEYDIIERLHSGERLHGEMNGENFCRACEEELQGYSTVRQKVTGQIVSLESPIAKWLTVNHRTIF
jgi:hypothetical protein